MSIETLAERYATGRISLAMLQVYVKKGVITMAEFELIINGQNSAE